MDDDQRDRERERLAWLIKRDEARLEDARRHSDQRDAYSLEVGLRSLRRELASLLAPPEPPPARLFKSIPEELRCARARTSGITAMPLGPNAPPQRLFE